ncbi:MAG: lysylphosphatidylglycerol synthase domain-containing protein, partial [Gemmatimonadota bacterium]
GLWGLAAAGSVGVVGLPALLATRVPLPELRPSSGLGERVAEFVRALADYRSVGAALWPAFGIALANQALAVLVVFVVFRAGGLEVPFVYFLSLVPVLHVSRLVPASIAGFGAEQGVVVALFHLAGVEPAAAMAMSVVVSGLNLVVHVLAGLLHVGVSARSLGRTLRDAAGAAPGEEGQAPAAGAGGTDPESAASPGVGSRREEA